MKPVYALLEFTCDSGSSDPAVNERIAALNKLSVESLDRYELRAGAPVPDLNACHFAVLYGSCSGAELIERCREVMKAQVFPVVVFDALSSTESLAGTLSRLEENLVQFTTTVGIIGCIKSGRTFIYPFAKSDCTASVCLLFDGGTQALVIERLHEPEKGKNAFPGGFLRVFLETVEECAYRELAEESGLKMLPGELVLVDIRSAPWRDPRSHIVDAGYAALVGKRRKQELILQLKAGDDACKAQLLPVAELLSGELAFDHQQFLLSSLKHFNLVS
jgi:8-oxo-dGTP diphosphatase